MGGEGGKHAVMIIQSKAPGVELGIATFNWDTARVADTSLYARTLQHLHLHFPSEVFVADNSRSSGSHHSYYKTEWPNKLVETIQKETGIKSSYLPRSVWNAEMGYELVKRYCVEDPYKTPFTMILSDRYYAQCAVAALFHWLHVNNDMMFNNASLKIEYETVRGQMFIDTESARNLEIVQNNLSLKTANTLHSVLNSCFTPMGLRALRSSLLQPSNDKNVINNRLDAVEVRERVEEENGFVSKMEWSDSGYRFSVLSDSVDSDNLPPGMLNIQRSKKYCKFTTHELLKRNARMQQSQEEVFNMSDKFVSSLCKELISYIPSLFAGSEAIGLVDVLTSFAGISSSQSYCRPKFGNSIEVSLTIVPDAEAD
ncbi:hypothetical protein CspeluHIS016_0203140 [Cutaneotrichosporon spelunceum]|uniref:DNA mismatch repair protein MutS core domain-containing protein n=1 Tax=Cutaneotrichosporon spelunceum TaxID=1672016 RepID=A0AAD3TQV0_9TREE|nr:hypothetical protein CspeluHIS016_0203140 [Cutaneotrichosporon spelunceum]